MRLCKEWSQTTQWSQWLTEFYAIQEIGKQHEQVREQIMDRFLFLTKCPKNQTRDIKPHKENEEQFDIIDPELSGNEESLSLDIQPPPFINDSL